MMGATQSNQHNNTNTNTNTQSRSNNTTAAFSFNQNMTTTSANLNHAVTQQLAAEEMMDSFTLNGNAGGTNNSAAASSSSNTSPRHPFISFIHTTGLRSGAGSNTNYAPSSPVSPLLEEDNSANKPIAQQQLVTAKAFLGSIQAQSHQQSTSVDNNPNVSSWSSSDKDSDMGLGVGTEMARIANSNNNPQTEEQIIREEEQDQDDGIDTSMPLDPSTAALLQHWQNAPHNSNTLMNINQINATGFYQSGDEAMEWIEEYEEEEEGADGSGTGTATAVDVTKNMTREQKLAYEEKTKERKKFAEMRYLVNAMFRCQDCMLAPTYMEHGFDHHAPPRRPAARPSAGPSDQFCCVGPALAEALPIDFPVDLIPIIHGYLLSDQTTRSFLTTPPLPSQQSIQCMILKTATRFELYLEMKNQETFAKMRQKLEEKERLRKQSRRRKRRGSAAGEEDDKEEDSEEKSNQPDAPAMEMEEDGTPPAPLHHHLDNNAHGNIQNASTSSSVNNTPNSAHPSATGVANEPPILSLDDTELVHDADGERSPVSQERVDESNMDTAETPSELKSPTISLDYEKLFPERPPAKKFRRVLRSNSQSNVLQASSSSSSSAATNETKTPNFFTNSNRRMSEPLLTMPSFATTSSSVPRLAPALMRRNSTTSAALSAGIATFNSHALTPPSLNRRLSGNNFSSFASGNLPPAHSSAAYNMNPHFPATRTNAINSMLKQHAESIIREGKDIFLLCAQRKRSWTGNHYIISSDRDNIRGDGVSYYGKLKSNFSGTEYTCTDNGVKSPSRRNMEKLQTHMYPTYSSAAPKETSRSAVAQWLSGCGTQPHVRHELACVLYDHFFCWGRGAQFMMFDGSIKGIENIKAGDELMGDDSTARRVDKLSQGRGHMFQIRSADSSRPAWSCNEQHILVLEYMMPPPTILPVPFEDGSQMFRVEYYKLVRGDDRFSEYPQKQIAEQLFESVHEAQHFVQQLPNQHSVITPVVFEVTVHDFLDHASEEVRSQCRMKQAECVSFPQNGTSLRERLQQLSAYENQVAWLLGVVAARGSIMSNGVALHLPPNSQVSAAVMQFYQQLQLPLHVESVADSSIIIHLGEAVKQLCTSYQLTNETMELNIELLTDSIAVRRALLAGFIDATGALDSKDLVWNLSNVRSEKQLESLKHLIRGLGLRLATADEHKFDVRVFGLGMTDIHPVTSTLQLSPSMASTVQLKHETSWILLDHFDVIAIGMDDFFGFQVSGANSRLLFADYLITHNSHTGSPIRIKVLLPNRSFDLVKEASVGGSIIKQYRIEAERAEKRKAEMDAKLAAMAPLPISDGQEEQSESDPDHSQQDGNTENQETLAPATTTVASTTNTSSSSSHGSAAVAPALAESAPEEPLDNSVDVYENLRPVWHDGMNAYVLHFDHHRVREKSVKNFRLVRNVPDPGSKVPGATMQQTVLQFGRVLDRNVFVMDYAYPLSALTAFQICLSSIDPKLAV